MNCSTAFICAAACREPFGWRIPSDIFLNWGYWMKCWRSGAGIVWAILLLIKGGVFPLFGDAFFSDFAQEFQADLLWDERRQIGMIFSAEGKKIVFSPDCDFLIIDYNQKKTIDYIKKEGKGFLFGPSAEKAVRQFLENSRSERTPVRVKAIIIDAGHGGKDPGAVAGQTLPGRGGPLTEKEVTLDVALRLEDKIRREFPDIPIVMTRTTDVYPDLKERTEIANRVAGGKDDLVLFVSIHVNSSINKSASGFEVWFLSQDVRRDVVPEEVKQDVDDSVLPVITDLFDHEITMESRLLSKLICDGLERSVGDVSRNRGIKEEEWFVVKYAKMPAVLVEVGFISNENEMKMLADGEYCDKIAEGVFTGIKDFMVGFAAVEE